MPLQRPIVNFWGPKQSHKWQEISGGLKMPISPTALARGDSCDFSRFPGFKTARKTDCSLLAFRHSGDFCGKTKTRFLENGSRAEEAPFLGPFWAAAYPKKGPRIARNRPWVVLRRCAAAFFPRSENSRFRRLRGRAFGPCSAFPKRPRPWRLGARDPTRRKIGVFRQKPEPAKYNILQVAISRRFGGSEIRPARWD